MRSGSKFLRGPLGRSLGLGLLTFLILAPVSFTKQAQTLENLGLDLGYRLQPVAPPPPELLIVGIDESSFQELRRPWPWPRRLHAELIRRLAAAGARLIVFDVIFAEPSTSEDDQLFAEAIKEAGNVILAQTLEITEDRNFSRQILLQPLESFRRAAKDMALTILTPDADGVVRHFRLRLGGMDTLPAAVARLLGLNPDIPPDLNGLIHYVGPPRHIDIVSYYQVLDRERPLPAARVQGRIILIGRMLEASATPRAQADAFYTPFFAGTGQLMSGVEIQANIIHTLLSRQWGRELPWAVRLALLLVLLLFYSFLLSRLSPLGGLGAMVGLVALLGGSSLFLLLYWHLWVPQVLLYAGMALIFTGNVLSHYLIEVREKHWLHQVLGRYVSPEVAEIVTSHPGTLELGGEEVEATVLFADLAGFTPLSEGMAPQALIRLLNEYFTPMTEIILAHQGTLDKYIGDAIMAFWGAPMHMADHALKACGAALEMQAAMPGLQRDWQVRGLPPLAARLGLHSGPVVAGNVGSRQRFNYTALGDTVNLAFRLEGANKPYGTDILLSGATYRQVADTFLGRELDQVQVKGRAQPVTLYELLGPLPEEGPPAWLQVFAAGRAAYLERDWLRAEALFQEVLSLKPGDAPAKLYLHRCRDYLWHPPSGHWRGVFILGNK